MGKRFTSLKQAQGLSKRYWVCRDDSCHKRHNDKVASCTICKGRDFWYFPSGKQADRWMHLLLQKSYGVITNLVHEQPFEFIENGEKVFTYRADAVYNIVRTGEQVVEDTKATKNPKGWDPEFKLKKKLIEARFGITINIVTGK